MSMLALPESECQEILAMFRQHLPHVPDAWLQELAENYGCDAIADIDPNDVIAILSVPGKLHRIRISLSQHDYPQKTRSRLHDALIAQDIEPGLILACLLTIHDSSVKLGEVGELIGQVFNVCSRNEMKGWACYINHFNAAQDSGQTSLRIYLILKSFC